MDAMDWAGLAVVAVPSLLALLAIIAEWTPFDWDNKAVAMARKIWSWVPIGKTDPKKMGKLK